MIPPIFENSQGLSQPALHDIWAIADATDKGSVTFNEFCLLYVHPLCCVQDQGLVVFSNRCTHFLFDKVCFVWLSFVKVQINISCPMWRSIIGAFAVPYSRNHHLNFNFLPTISLDHCTQFRSFCHRLLHFFHGHRSQVSPVVGLDWLDPASSICFPLAIPLSTITKLTQVFHSTDGASSGYNHFDFCSLIA